MRVLFLTYPHSGLFRGGMETQIAKTAAALGELGVEVIFYSPWKDEIPMVDLCHVFGTDGSMLHHVERARDREKPTVISPIFNAFGESTLQLRLKAKISQLVPGMRKGLAISRRMLHAAARIIALNEAECLRLIKVFGLPPARCVVIPNGINRAFMAGDPVLANEKYGVTDYVLQVGAVVPRKNQLTLVRATAQLRCPTMIVGETGDADYVGRCRAYAGPKVIFTGALDYADPLLASVFAGAKLFVLPSFSEVMPLSLYEAAVSGCRVIASRTFPIAQEVSEFVPRFDPNDAEGLARLIQRAMALPLDPRLTERARAMPTWHDVAREVLHIYQEALNESKGTGGAKSSQMKRYGSEGPTECRDGKPFPKWMRPLPPLGETVVRRCRLAAGMLKHSP